MAAEAVVELGERPAEHAPSVLGLTREVLGLTREVLAYYRERISLERELAAAQAAWDAANQVQWAGFHSAVLF